MQERRSFHRLASKERTSVRKDGAPIEASLLDISLGGMRLITNQDLKRGTSITGEFKINPKTGIFYMHGEVIWVKPIQDGTCEVGIKFTKINTIPF